MNAQPTRIVLIEDEPFFQEFYVECFQESGLNDVIVLGGAVGLTDLLRQQYTTPMVIVTDYTLPESTPADFIPALRAAGIRAPVLIQTGSEADEEIDRWLALGWIAGYFLKGVGVGLMMDRIVKVIGELRPMAEARLYEYQLQAPLKATLDGLSHTERQAALALLQLQTPANIAADRLDALRQSLGDFLAQDIGTPALRSALLHAALSKPLS
jgi:DNA-binding NarL/FixJ family response regulator